MMLNLLICLITKCRQSQADMQLRTLSHNISYFQYEPISCSGWLKALYLGKSSSCHSSFTSMFSILRVASVVPIPQRGKLGLKVWGKKNPLSIGQQVKSLHEINPHESMLDHRMRN